MVLTVQATYLNLSNFRNLNKKVEEKWVNFILNSNFEMRSQHCEIALSK